VNRRRDVVEYPASPPADTAVVRQGVFPGKLRIPPVGASSLVRPRLLRLLDAAIAAGSVVISAPAGSGKTELAAAWTRHQRTPRDVAWITLDEGDRDPARFLKYVVAAIRTTPGGRRAMAALAALPSSTVVDETYLLTLSDAMGALTADVVLVLDDVQSVVGSASEVLLRRVLRYPPERVRLLVLSRVEPALGQDRLRLQGLLREVRGQDLAFTPAESAELLTRHGVLLTDQELESFQARTLGWAAGVKILAASRPDPARANDLITRLDADGTFVGDYLMAEVFADQSPEVQRFLLRAATANPICGSLAGALTGRSSGAATLEILYREHLFLDRVEEIGGERFRWYRWHPMFAAMLGSRLQATDPDLAGWLHRTAADWLRKQGLRVDAVRQSLAGGDVDAATADFATSWLDLVLADETAVVRSLLAGFAEPERLTRPELAAACAFVHLQERELTQASRFAKLADRLAAGLPTDRRLAVEVISAVVCLHVATMTGRRDNHHSAGLLLLDQLAGDGRFLAEVDRRRRALLLYHLGAFEVSDWRLDESLAHLTEAMAEAAALDLPDLVLRCRVQLASLDFVTGRVAPARVAVQECLDAAEARGWHSHHNLATAYLVRGGVALLQARTADALRDLTEARERVHPVDMVNAFRIEVMTQSTLRAAGLVAEAGVELEALRGRVARWRAPPWVPMMLELSQAEQLVAEQRPDEALQLLESLTDLDADPVPGRRWRALRGRLLVRAGRPAEARAVLEPVLAVADRWPVDVLALVVDALACEGVGRHEEALATLARALHAAAPAHVVQPFLGSGREVRGLLEELLDRGTVDEAVVVEVLDHLAGTDGAAPATLCLLEPLTARELQVLRELQGTASYDEIAQRMFVSPNTLRTHVKHIHRKLGTNNRRRAVTRGRELALI